MDAQVKFAVLIHRLPIFARIKSTVVNPSFHDRDQFRGQLLIGWHLQFWMVKSNCLDQQTRFGTARHNRSTRITTFLPTIARIQHQASIRLGLTRMTRQTILSQRWTNPFFKLVLLINIDVCRRLSEKFSFIQDSERDQQNRNGAMANFSAE